jgi:hypothetical protein
MAVPPVQPPSGDPSEGPDPKPLPIPGWYENPENIRELRWWDGTTWTATTQPAPASEGTQAAQPKPSVAPGAADPKATSAAAGGAGPATADASTSAIGTKHVGIYAATCVALIIFLAVVTSGSSKKSTAPSIASSAPASLPIVDLSIGSPADGTTVKKKNIKLKGTVMTGANVTVSRDGGDATAVDVKSNGTWATTQPLAIGSNSLTVSATAPARSNAETSVIVTRKRSRAELAAIQAKRVAAQRKRAAAREAARQKRAAAKAAFEADYKAGAKSISYKQLEKGADNYSGERAVFRGQVFQIQESGGYGYMLLSVTDLGYDIWTDNVWVNFNRSTKFVEDDIVTVWGPIDGSKSYDTQIGGTTFVPEMTAKYMSAG